MGVEIERKFLVADDSWRDNSGNKGRKIKQGYLSSDPRCTVRVRQISDLAYITIKGLPSEEDGLTRPEFEYSIDPSDVPALLKIFCTGKILEKTRWIVPHEGHKWEIDVFEGANEDLVVAEIELNKPDEEFAIPPWLGEEVTDDTRYLNSNLIRIPYCRFRK